MPTKYNQRDVWSHCYLASAIYIRIYRIYFLFSIENYELDGRLAKRGEERDSKARHKNGTPY